MVSLTFTITAPFLCSSIVGILGLCVLTVCVFEHADIISIRPKPLPTYSQKAVSLSIWIGSIAAIILFLCGLCIMRTKHIVENRYEAILILLSGECLFIAACWIVSFTHPSSETKKEKTSP